MYARCSLGVSTLNFMRFSNLPTLTMPSHNDPVFRLIIPLEAIFLGRVFYGEVVRPGRFDRMVRSVGLGFPGHVGLSWRLRTVDGDFHSRHHGTRTTRTCDRFQERSNPIRMSPSLFFERHIDRL
jgi:hypothetical protein